MNKIYVRIKGITCDNCQEKLTKALTQLPNITYVYIENNIAVITYKDSLVYDDVIKCIVDLGYYTNKKMIQNDKFAFERSKNIINFILYLSIITLIICLLNYLVGFNLLNYVPTFNTSFQLSSALIAGLLTSIHCLSMCGSLNLFSSVNSKEVSLKNNMFYNLGRILSYTIAGFIAGLLGQSISINSYVSAGISLVCSIIMLLLSLKMLGVINFKFQCFSVKLKLNPFFIGLLNFIMPCGPLQTMELLALSSQNPWQGALIMLAFGIGTLPTMLGLSAILKVFIKRHRIFINRLSCTTLFLLSLFMLNRSLLSLNIDLNPTKNNENYLASTLKDNEQIIEFSLDYDHYEDILVQVDVPVKMIINVSKEYLTGCNNEIIINTYDVKQKLVEGENIIEFTPTKTGIITYTCWMNMIKNNIKIVDNINI